MADELGIFDIVRNETVTCYNGIPGDGCGHCPSCLLRREGLEKYLQEKHGKEKYGKEKYGKERYGKER